MEAITKPTILSGVLELSPEDQRLFEKMLEVIRKHFTRHAYYPLDTTVMEKSEVLLAKGGGETEKQIYRFEKGSNDISLRFDLTVPLARYVAQHFSELEFPFNRYQIGKVYRGERKQKGRYREFYQCDVDIIGHNTLHVLNDAQIPKVMDEIFQELRLPHYAFFINNRVILNAYLEKIGVTDPVETLRILDKLMKIGEEKVKEELLLAGISQPEEVLAIARITGTNTERLDALSSLCDSDRYKQGVKDLQTVYEGMLALDIPEDRIVIDPTITRGLDYYTGTVYETFITDHEEIGSICSGGRYDNLSSHYTKQELPGVGMSIGLTRLFTKLREDGLMEIETDPVADVAIVTFPGTEIHALRLANQLREAGCAVMVQLEKGKIGKKMQTIDKRGIPHVILLGEDEVKNGTATLRDMHTGEQVTKKLDEVIADLV